MRKHVALSKLSYWPIRVQLRKILFKYVDWDRGKRAWLRCARSARNNLARCNARNLLMEESGERQPNQLNGSTFGLPAIGPHGAVLLALPIVPAVLAEACPHHAALAALRRAFPRVLLFLGFL